MARRSRGERLIQEARELQALLQRSKLSLRAVARRRKVSPASLSQLMAILKLPEDILAEVEAHPELASKTKLAMLSRVEGEARDDMWQQIRAGVSSDTLRGRKRAEGVPLSDRSRQTIDAVGRALRRELAGELPAGSFTEAQVAAFAVELLGQLFQSRRREVSRTYLDFIGRLKRREDPHRPR